MDYSKFPYQRGAAGAGVGVRQARMLGAMDTPALRRQNADGSVSRKVGERLYVDPAPEQELDAYLSSGTYPDGLVRAVASADARGVFRGRGQVMRRAETNAWNSTALHYYGNGKASVFKMTWAQGDAESVADFNGWAARVLDVGQYESQNGTLYGEVYAIKATQTYLGAVSPFTTNINFVAPTRVRSGEKSQWLYEALSGVTCIDGQYRFFYVVDVGSRQLYANIKTVAYQLAKDFAAITVSPLGRFGIGSYMRPQYPQLEMPHPIDVSQCPGIEFHYSEDGGLNFESVDSAPILQEFTDTVLALNSHIQYAPTFNLAVNFFSSMTVPLNAQQAAVLMAVPYVTEVRPGSYAVNAKIKLGVVDFVSRTVVETAVLEDSVTPPGESGWDGAEAAAVGYMAGWGGVPIKGGALFVVRPLGAADYRDNPPRCLFTTDGVNIQWQPPMPWPGWCVGVVRAISKDTIVAPVYEPGRGYVLYQSDDLGASWKLRATLSSNARAPQKISSRAYLLEFSQVTKLRDGAAPANATPGAPWVSDTRFTPPNA